jgi:hypothetical protein
MGRNNRWGSCFHGSAVANKYTATAAQADSHVPVKRSPIAWGVI